MNDTVTTTLPRTKERRPRTWLRMTIMLLLVGLVAAGLIGFQHFKAGILKQVVQSIRTQVPTVATAKASMQEWQARQTAVGSARASKGADLAAEIGGVVDQISIRIRAEMPRRVRCCCGCARMTTMPSWRSFRRVRTSPM